jgi:isopentenyl-diphosphate delta-isomerase
MKNEDVILIKLGGSLLTDKKEPFSLREQVCKNIINQIVNAQKKLILVHGGGSFGHPLAEKYKINQGINDQINDQLIGLAKTHEAMTQLNSFVVNEFLKHDYPTIPLQPSSIFIKNTGELSLINSGVVKSLLDLNIMPVLYGDILIESDNNFRILSGDEIILKLCENLSDLSIKKVIFAMDKDGLFIRKSHEDKSYKLADKLSLGELDNICLANLNDKKIDVTGGINKKLDNIKKICQLGIPVQVINGLKENFIQKSLCDDEISCTNITTNSKTQFKNISNRKIDHLKIPLKYDVQHSKNYFDDIKLLHYSLPERKFNEIDISTIFFEKNVSAPICIAAITGGHPIAGEINSILAQVAEKEKIILSVGSQRAGLNDKLLRKSFSVVRKYAPSIPIIGNIGIGQLSDSEFNVDLFLECIDMIKADVMAIHFNALHELVQHDGDTDYTNFWENFSQIRESVSTPIIAKEVGTGLNHQLIRKLEKNGFDGFDVGGSGGTSFALIESRRKINHTERISRKLSETFREWGIPTPISIIKARKVTDKLLIATGGLRDGIDIAKSIVLGADLGGFAYKFLKTSWKDYQNNSIDSTLKEVKTLKNELKSSMWLMNVGDLHKLKLNEEKRVLLGKLYEWLNQ